MSPDNLSLHGKTAIITGSGRENGTGAAIAKALARNGCSVAIHYVSDPTKPRAEKLAADISKEFGTKTTVVQGGVEIPANAQRIVQQTLKALDVEHIDILVNNGGTGSSLHRLLTVMPEVLHYDFGVNVFGVIYMTQAVVNIGKMPSGGRIINIGTVASKLVPDGMNIYAAAKAAQDALTTSWASELGKSHGITVNTLAPGPIYTDISKDHIFNDDGSPNEMGQAQVNITRAANRLGTPEDLADATLLLVSEKSRWITAQWISVSGGVVGTM